MKIRLVTYISSIFFALLCSLLSNTAEDRSSDLIIFSYDRPMQLFALLESIDVYVTGLNEVVVIYRASNERYQKAYAQVYEQFSRVVTMKQENPPQDFKQLTLCALHETSSDYILFAVDDIVVKDAIDLAACIALLEQTGAYGFYLRLGKNLSHCYPVNAHQPLPLFNDIADGICAWQFSSGTLDWKYPHTVDMTLYKKADVLEYFETLSYNQPNTLESVWAGRGRGPATVNKYGLCFECSKIVNLPLNKVQNVYDNRCMYCYSPFQLLEKFEQGIKIDIAPLHKICNNSAHMSYVPTFIAR